MGKITGFILLAFGAGLFTGFLQNFLNGYCVNILGSLPAPFNQLLSAATCATTYGFFTSGFLAIGSLVYIGIALLGIYMIWES